MAIVKADGFDHYGNGGNFDPGYFGGGAELRIDGTARTGPAYISFGGFTYIAFPGVTSGGFAIGIRVPQLSDDGRANRFNFNRQGGYDDYSNGIGVKFMANGRVRLDTGRDQAPIAESDAGVIQTNQWFHMEVKWDFTPGTGTGFVGVRINNKLVVSAVVGSRGSINCMTVTNRTDFDDLILWDTSGTRNFDYVGDLRCHTILPNGDGPNQDWTPATGAVGFDMIDNVPADASKFITADAAGEVSNFDLSQVPNNTSYIAAVVVAARIDKTDAGPCTIEMGLESAGQYVGGPELFPAVTAAYMNTVLQDDPGGTYWTRETINAARLRITRKS